MSNRMQLKNHIRFYRRLNDMDKTSFGKKLDVCARTITNFEEGRTYPPIDFAYRVSKLLNVPMDELFFEEHNEPEKRMVFMDKK